MKYKKILATIMFGMLCCCFGCTQKNQDSQLATSWYMEGEETEAFILYDDNTCKIANEYGTGTWEVVNGEQLKITNYYGETQTANIVSIEDGCLILGNGEREVIFWNSAEKAMEEQQEEQQSEQNLETVKEQEDVNAMQTVSYIMETESNGLKMIDTMTLSATGDAVQMMTEVIELDLSEFDEDTQIALVEVYSDIVDQYNSVEGVECSAESDEDRYTITINIDATGDAVSQLVDLGLLQVEGNMDSLSLSGTGDALEASGYRMIIND